MRTEPPLPQDIWDLIPPVAQAAMRALCQQQADRIEQLELQVQRLQAQLQQRSSQPPAAQAEPPKRRPPDPPSTRKRGAQPGHPPHQRPLVPPERVQHTIPRRPTHCRRCGGRLAGDDPQPLRHQVWELPPIRLDVTEYQLHRLTCPHCGIRTAATVPDGVPPSGIGPRLQAFLSLLTGVVRLSKRGVENLCRDLLGQPISPGEIGQLEQATAAALDPPVAEAAARVPTEAANVDETSWRQSGRWVRLWVAVTATVTVFWIRTSKRAAEAHALLGQCYQYVLTSDRAKTYNGFCLSRRQVCWAHLRRDFQAMIDRGGAAADMGRRLLGHADVRFTWWHRVRDGTLARSTFRRDVQKLLRPAFRADLEAGVACGCAKTAGTCRELLKVETALWTFVRREGIEPTNNAAERALRHGVQWRKTSYGTHSPGGSHFVANILTVVATCRQHGRPILDFLTQCCQAALTHTQPPSLLPSNP